MQLRRGFLGLLVASLLAGCSGSSSSSGGGTPAPPSPPPVVTIALPGGVSCAGKVSISSASATVNSSTSEMIVKVCITCSSGSSLAGVTGIKGTLQADNLPQIVARMGQATFSATDSTGCATAKVNLKLGGGVVADPTGKSVEVRVVDANGGVQDKMTVTVK